MMLMKTEEQARAEQAVCNHCENPIPLFQLRQGRCFKCLNDVDPWGTGFAGELHGPTARKVVDFDDH